MSQATLTQIKDCTANPAPLGLLAFGMTTVLLNPVSYTHLTLPTKRIV